MEFQKCSKCSSEFAFGRAVCPRCGSKEFSMANVTGAVALDSVKLIATPEPFPDGYSVVLFQAESGAKGFCRTNSEIRKGDRLKIGMDEYGPVCVPA